MEEPPPFPTLIFYFTIFFVSVDTLKKVLKLNSSFVPETSNMKMPENQKWQIIISNNPTPAVTLRPRTIRDASLLTNRFRNDAMGAVT